LQGANFAAGVAISISACSEFLDVVFSTSTALGGTPWWGEIKIAFVSDDLLDDFSTDHKPTIGHGKTSVLPFLGVAFKDNRNGAVRLSRSKPR
jgi:hypothetical protein